MATPIAAVLLVTRLFSESSTSTVTAGVIAAPAVAFEGCWPKASFVAAPGFTVKELLVPVITLLPPIPVAAIVKFPVLLMVTLVISTPLVNDGLVIGAPTSAPVEVSITLFPLASNDVTVLLAASLAVTVIPNAVPAVWGLAIVENVKWSKAPAFTVKLVLVALASAPSEAVKVNDPVTVGTRFAKVATPLDATTVVVELPLNTPPVLMAMVTLELSPVTTLPTASCTCATTAGVIAWPAFVLVGCCVNTNLLATPAAMLNAVLVALVKRAPLAVNV